MVATIQQFVGGTASNRRKALLQAAAEYIPEFKYEGFVPGQPPRYKVIFRGSLVVLEKNQVEGFIAALRLAVASGKLDDASVAQIAQHRFP